MGGDNQLYGQGIYTRYTGRPWTEEGKVFCKYDSYEDTASDNAFYQDYQLVTRTVEVTDPKLIERWVQEGVLSKA